MRSFVERVGVAAIACLISIPSFPALVNAASRKDARLIVSETMKAGVPFVLTVSLGRHLGFSEDMQAKVVEVPPESSPDEEAHGCDVVLDRAGPDGKPQGLLLMRRKKTTSVAKSHYFRLSQDGTLERAIATETRYDPDGKVIRGSGVATPLDVKDPEVLKALEREVAFWRKHFAKKRAPAKKP